jgi:predicted transcriptional regulator
VVLAKRLGDKRNLRQEKRHKLQIFYELLCGIEQDTSMNSPAKPTHIQHYSRLSYDKMLNYVDELERKGMIHRENGGLITITQKGNEFTKQYTQLMNLIESAGL